MAARICPGVEIPSRSPQPKLLDSPRRMGLVKANISRSFWPVGFICRTQFEFCRVTVEVDVGDVAGECIDGGIGITRPDQSEFAFVFAAAEKRGGGIRGQYRAGVYGGVELFLKLFGAALSLGRFGTLEVFGGGHFINDLDVTLFHKTHQNYANA